VHHLAIKVRDLKAAEQFYVAVLGLRVARRWPAAGGVGDRSVWLDLGDEAGGGVPAGAAFRVPFLALETLAAPGVTDAAVADAPHPDVERPGHHLVAFRIRREQRSEWEARLAAAGVVVSHRSDYTLYFRDPEGNRLGLSHHPDPATGS
jgi:catechol 2,3-dioxygenase-like lactoylglutathione lyase family enzyme